MAGVTATTFNFYMYMVKTSLISEQVYRKHSLKQDMVTQTLVSTYV